MRSLILFPVILVFCGIGVFSLNNSDFDIFLMALFGFLGYVFAKIDCEPHTRASRSVRREVN